MRKDQKKETFMHSLFVSVCPCLNETLCAHNFCMGMFGAIALTCRVLAYDQRKQIVCIGTAAPWFFTSKFLLLPLKVPKEECD